MSNSICVPMCMPILAFGRRLATALISNNNPTKLNLVSSWTRFKQSVSTNVGCCIHSSIRRKPVKQAFVSACSDDPHPLIIFHVDSSTFSPVSLMTILSLASPELWQNDVSVFTLTHPDGGDFHLLPIFRTSIAVF
jgi:hypothetical protein